MKTRKIVQFGILLLGTVLIFSCRFGNSALNEEDKGKQKYLIKTRSYDMRVSKTTFSFSFWKDSIEVVPEHQVSGIFLNENPIVDSEEVKTDENEGSRLFLVTNSNGEKAKVSISNKDDNVALTIIPLDGKAAKISLALGGMPVAHGLGDAAAFHESFNIVDNKQGTYDIQNDGGGRRWVSTFAIFPKNNFAGVFFDKGKKTITITEEEYMMTITKKGEVTFHYFLGGPKTIYASYKKAREVKGYNTVKPKSRLFELGWESWDALGWNANQFTVQEILQKFHDNAYPIRWAVTGSGFWDEGGTTTSFGRWGKKFPNANSFKEWMHSNDIYWMIGLRTNLIPEGGPYYPKTKKRDKNLKVNAFYGNTLTTEAREKGFLVTKENGEIFNITSGIFPIVPSNLLNGTVPGAAQWYQEQYAKWDVDGIKEDTMMDLDSLTNIYNGPITEIADKGGHVMARNGEFIALGTLLRINDTGVGELATRIPINYMQYAASGFPNVYSDVAGVHNMHNLKNIDRNIRHTWLLSLTAGLAVGAYPEKWPEKKREVFKKAIDFHHTIGPYMYSEALKGFESGYPTTLTPLGLAFPEDEIALDLPNFQWMIGESLLAAPLLENIETGKKDVYLPKGIWFDYESGEKFEGPKMLNEYDIPLDKVPCFVGGKGVIVERRYHQESFQAKIYLTGLEDNQIEFTYPNGTDRNRINASSIKSLDNLVLMDKTTNDTIPYKVEHNSGVLSFNLIRNHNYELQNK